MLHHLLHQIMSIFFIIAALNSAFQKPNISSVHECKWVYISLLMLQTEKNRHVWLRKYLSISVLDLNLFDWVLCFSSLSLSFAFSEWTFYYKAVCLRTQKSVWYTVWYTVCDIQCVIYSVCDILWAISDGKCVQMNVKIWTLCIQIIFCENTSVIFNIPEHQSLS